MPSLTLIDVVAVVGATMVSSAKVILPALFVAVGLAELSGARDMLCAHATLGSGKISLIRPRLVRRRGASRSWRRHDSRTALARW